MVRQDQQFNGHDTGQTQGDSEGIGEALCAAVTGVAKSRTQPSD